jgi:hypothetical protein
MQFVPLWTSILRSRKVATLPDDLYRTWTLCLLTAQEHDHKHGSLPSVDDLSYSLHMSNDNCLSRLSRLVTLKFLDLRDGIYYIHDWDDWKHKPDPTGTARKQAQREREREQLRKAKEVTERNGEHDTIEDVTDVTVTSVTSQMSQCHAPTQLNYNSTTTQRQPPQPPAGTNVVESSSSEDEPPEFPDALTTIVTIQSGDQSFSEHEARKVWGHIWRTWKDVRLCYGFYERQRWCSVKGWLYAIERATKQGQRPGSIKYLQKIGMDFDVNGPKQEKPLTKGDIGSVPYVPTSQQTENKKLQNHNPLPAIVETAPSSEEVQEAIAAARASKGKRINIGLTGLQHWVAAGFLPAETLREFNLNP